MTRVLTRTAGTASAMATRIGSGAESPKYRFAKMGNQRD
jgi:hypothetical protein